jgi:poly(A) polymerase
VEITRNIMARLRFSREESEQVEALVANHMRFMDAPKMKASTLKRFLRLPQFDEHLELHRQDCLSSHGGLDNYEFVQETRDKLGEEEISPPRLVNGADLIAAGYRPGPRFGEVLRAVEDAQLEGRVRDREAALALAKSLMDTQAPLG